MNKLNTLDKQYTDLLQDILDNGVKKQDRTGTGTISVFGRQIRHNMKDGFPLLTTKKMPFKTIVTELLWFLRGDTNIKYLVDNGCHIWDGDTFKNFMTKSEGDPDVIWNQEQFINKIKTDDEFAKKWGELGPIYGKQWRRLIHHFPKTYPEVSQYEQYIGVKTIDQITNLINDLKTNPDSRRLMVSAWNVGELGSMVLPPCHYGFQVYTTEMTNAERCEYWAKLFGKDISYTRNLTDEKLNDLFCPKRKISLMWNQRSVDVPLGLPFNIASYGLLLSLIGKIVNMVPDQLIGNLGDTHIYLNQIEGCKEQIGKVLSLEERRKLWESTGMGWKEDVSELLQIQEYNCKLIPKRTREPFPLPTLNINTEFWLTQGGECGIGLIDTDAITSSFNDDHFCKCLLNEDIQLENYVSHPTIKFPLSN